jgi:hypothetical protein
MKYQLVRLIKPSNFHVALSEDGAPKSTCYHFPSRRAIIWGNLVSHSRWCPEVVSAKKGHLSMTIPKVYRIYFLLCISLITYPYIYIYLLYIYIVDILYIYIVDIP